MIWGTCLPLGCKKQQNPQGPAAVVLEFVDAMRQVHGGAAAGRRVLDLVWKPARANLKERARRASALSSRELLEGELITPSWFALRFVPEKTQERIDGEWAEVILMGRSGQQAVARCVQEEGKWKVALELPPLAPIRQRVEPD